MILTINGWRGEVPLPWSNLTLSFDSVELVGDLLHG